MKQVPEIKAENCVHVWKQLYNIINCVNSKMCEPVVVFNMPMHKQEITEPRGVFGAGVGAGVDAIVTIVCTGVFMRGAVDKPKKDISTRDLM